MILTLLIAAVLGYLLGSIPFGLLITRAAGLGDVRSIGSGNIGATNVLRTGKKGLAAATLLADMLKGTVAVVLAGVLLRPEAAVVAGFAAFIGHIFPVWLDFKGGKGVATYLGVLAGLAYPMAILFAVVWIGVAYAKRYSSLAALAACVAVPAGLVLLGQWRLGLVFTAMSVIVFVKHSANIERLRKGAETRIGSGT